MNDSDNVSFSQLGQDLWVIETLDYKNKGFFIDIGAADGVKHSNTNLLEKKYQWSGICIEANPFMIPMLSSNRNCMCVHALLDNSENIEKTFYCANEISFLDNINRPLSIEQTKNYVETSGYSFQPIKMKTSKINKILENYNCPYVIDYISCDTEGTELDILKEIPFDDYHVNIITIEHNAPHIGTKYQNEIRKFLENNDFRFIKGNEDLLNWRHGPIEDFYINNNILKTDGTIFKATQYLLTI